MSGRLAFVGAFFFICLISSVPGPSCCGQETAVLESANFRVETDVFFGSQKAPAQQSLTLFSSGVAYDISLNDPNQITMVDPARNRIVLLDKAQRSQTSIDLRELHKFIDAVRKQAETSELATYLQGANKIEVANDMVAVGDSVLQYKSTLQQPRDEQMAEQYARVADALMLLNAWHSRVPPFARLNLNRVVAEQKSLPEEITRTTSGNNQTEVVRCRLHANWRLSKDDDRQIADIGKMLVTFQSVASTDFFAAKAKATSGDGAKLQ